MAKRITVMALLIILSACTIMITTPNGSVFKIEPEGAYLTIIPPVGTNTPTPVFQRYLTVRASTNLRATPSTASAIVQVIRVDTQALVLTEQGAWYRVRIPNGTSNFFEGWVRNDRTTNLITVTATPQPTPTRPAPTPTQERILNIEVPFEGLQGYLCQSEACASSTLRLEFLDNYRVLFMNNAWAWVCKLAIDGTGDCISQFYVRLDK